MRPILAVALLALVVSAGCAGTFRVSEEPPDGVTTDADAATSEAPTTAAETASATTGRPTVETLSSEPQKGDQFLSVTRLNESEAMDWDADKRASFGNLSAERRRVVRKALDCSCNVVLDGEFSFYDEERIEVVEYEGTYYFLRVAIV